MWEMWNKMYRNCFHHQKVREFASTDDELLYDEFEHTFGGTVY